MLGVELIPGHLTHQHAPKVKEHRDAAERQSQLHQVGHRFDESFDDGADRALDRIPPRALGQFRDTSIQGGDE